MDPFLPGEIPVMVLRYLAANQCTATAMKLIDEMPKMSDYIPAKPANVSEKGYLKHLLRSSANRGLKDVLWDYGNSRILVEDMLDTDNDNDLSSSFTSDTLLSKIEILQKMLEKLSQSSSSGSNCKPQPPQSDNDRKPKPPVITVDNYANTEDFECPKCTARRLEVKATSESGCQTEEYTAVQFGLQDDITMIFCKKLLDDNNLQQKISDTINEHMLDPHNKQNKDFLQKVSSKAESEIDKFLVELLQDMPEDECNSNSLPSDIGLLSNGSSVLAGPSSFAEIEKNLTAMFKDTEIMQGNSTSSGAANQTSVGAEATHKLVLHTPTSDPAQPTCSTKALVDMLVETPSPNSSRSNDIAADVTPESSNDTKTRLDSEKSTVSNNTPKRSRRPPAVKRITPTPLASAKANPVFNTSVVVENKTVDMGDKCAKIAVVTKNIETPQWQKLNRRSIAPKIPVETQPKIIDNVTVRKLITHEEKVVKIGEDINNDHDNNQFDDVILISGVPSASTANTSVSSSAIKKTVTTALIQENQPSAHKRKATPVKLTPEKAKNTDYNFVHIYHDSNKKTGSVLKSNDAENTVKNVNADSVIKKTPLPIYITSESGNVTGASSISNKLGLLTENSQPDVTPMQPIPEESDYTTSDLNTISPNALQRLIASASKAGNVAAAARFAHKRKSYSTPRKRKHVRSLTFASPPSVKAVTPGDHAMGERSASQKRKATEDLFSAELRSKKRLNWPASAEKSGCAEKRGPPQKPGRGEKSGFTEKPGFAFADKVGFAFVGKPVFAENFVFAEKPSNSKERGFIEKTGRVENLRTAEAPRSTENPGIIPNLGIANAETPRFTQMPPNVAQLVVAEAPRPTEKAVIVADLGISEVPRLTEKPRGVKKLVIDETPAVADKHGFIEDPTNADEPAFTEKSVSTDKPGFTEKSVSTDKRGFTEKSVSTDKRGVAKKPKFSEKPIDKPRVDSPELDMPGFTHKIKFSQKHGFSEKAANDAKPGFSNSNKSAETSLSSDQSPIEPEYEHKKRRARTKKTPVTKKPKPKVTLKITSKDLFGESPCKPKNLPPSKRSADVIAAQAVADQAVPLGHPRESVRNYHITPLVSDGSFQSPFKGIGNSPPPVKENAENKVVAPEPSVVLPPIVIQPTPQQVEAPEPEPPIIQIQEYANTTFNIVPAPLGFPEPTPVKFVYEIGGHKNSNNGFNSPLITPFKKAPPPNLNETQFTLPPTPRMVFEDPDSNSNSMHSLKYSFPLDLWTSTPMKQEVPRTPGRAPSSSSNSHSPILPVRSTVVTQVTNLQLPPSTSVLSIVPVTSRLVTQQSTTPPAPSPRKVVLSSPDTENSEQKSEGELSSSSEDDVSNASKPTVKIPKSPQKLKPQQDNTVGRRQPPPLLNIPPQQPHVRDNSGGNHKTRQSQNRPEQQPRVRNDPVVHPQPPHPQSQNRPEQLPQVSDISTVHSQQQPPAVQNGPQHPQATSNTVDYSQPPVHFKKSRTRQAHQASLKVDGQSQPPAPSGTPYQQTQVTHSQPPVILTRPHQQLQIREGVVRHPPQLNAPLICQQPPVRDNAVCNPQPPVLLARPQQVATTSSSMMQYPQAHIHNRIDRHLPHIQSHVSQQQVNPYPSRQPHGISFQVRGREKQLTLSEQETLVSLINMSNVKVNAAFQSKENPPPQNLEAPPSSQPKATEVMQKPNDEEKIQHQLIKNVNLNSFIGLLRRKAGQDNHQKTTK